MILHNEISAAALHILIRKKGIILAGNIPARIYGTLRCSSGKRMKKEYRVFFADLNEAIDAGFRPCGNCMRQDYKRWKGMS